MNINSYLRLTLKQFGPFDIIKLSDAFFLRRILGNPVERSEYFSNQTSNNLSPPPYHQTLSGEWSDETPLSPNGDESHLHSPLQQQQQQQLPTSTTDGGCETNEADVNYVGNCSGGGLSLVSLSSNFASVQQLPAFPSLNDFAHHGDSVLSPEKFQTLITMYRAHSQHVLDLVSQAKTESCKKNSLILSFGFSFNHSQKLINFAIFIIR